MTCTLQVSASTTAHLGWADIPSYPAFSIENYVTGGKSYTSNGNETLSALTLITGAQSSGVTPGAGLEASGNISLDFSKTPDNASLSDVTILHMGRLFAGSGVNVTQAETLYQTGSVSGLQTSSLTVSGATVKVAGTRHDDSPSDNRVGASGHPEFSFETKRSSAKQSNADNASLRSTLGATGDVKFQNQSTLILGKGSHLLSQTGSIAFDEYSTFVIDESVSQDGFGTVSGNDALVWSHGQILAKNTSNYVASSTGNVWIETHIGDIDWQGKEFNARLVSDSGILNGSGNISIVTLQRTEDKTHNSGAISLTNGSVEAAYKDKNGKVTLAANGTLNNSGIALNNTKVLGNTVVLVANIDLKGTDDQALKSLSNAQNNILDLSNGAHIGKLGVTGEPQDSSEQATESLTIYADAVLNDRSGGEATNITVKGGVSLDETTSGDYASHLIAQNELDIDASDKDVSIQNGAYLQTTGTDEAGITIEANAVNMGTTGDKTGSSISTGGGKVSVTAGSISMGTGSLLGNESTGNVELTSSSITLNSDSHINSSGEVKIVASEGNDLSISMDKQTSPGQNPSSIKGYKVTIGDDQRGGTFIEGGSIVSSGEGVEISGGISKEGGTSGVVINESIISTDEDGSVEITAAADSPIQIGTEKDGENIDKDTQIIGGNITIGSAEGTVNNPISVSDAVIGTVGGAGSGDITINAGSGKVDVTGSTVGTGSKDESTSAAGKVEIAGGAVTIGSSSGEGAGDGGAFDTAIGGSSITIGGGNTGSVTVGDAQIGSGSESGQTGSNVTIQVGNNGKEPGKITIGSVDGSTDTSISGDSVTIGAANDQSKAEITISGERDETGDSTTDISGDKVVIGDSNTGKVDISGSQISSENGTDASVSIVVGDEGSLSISGSGLTSQGSVSVAGGTGAGSDNSISGSTITSEKEVTVSGGSKDNAFEITGGSTVTAGGDSGAGSVHFGTDAGDQNGSNVVINGGSTVKTDNVDIAAGTDVTLGGGADNGGTIHIKDNTSGGQDSGRIDVSGSLTVNNGGGITSDGDVVLGTEGDGSISVENGGSIVAGTEDNGGDIAISGDVNVNGGSLAANASGEEGSQTGGNINIAGGDLHVNGGSVSADAGMKVDGNGQLTVGGEKGSVSVGGAFESTDGSTVAVGGNDGDSGSIVADGNVSIGGGLEISGEDSVVSSGKGDVELNGSTDIANGGSVVSEAGDVTLGGKVTVDDTSRIDAEHDVTVTGDVTISAGEDGGNSAPVISAGDQVIVGNTSGANDGASITVDSGADAVIVAGGSESDNGNNVVVGSGGSISVGTDEDGNSGKLTIAGSEDAAAGVENDGGLHIADNTTVSVGDNGVLESDKIVTEGENSSIELDGGRLTTTGDSLVTKNEDGTYDSNINISYGENGSDSKIDIAGEYTQEEVGQIIGSLTDESGNGPIVIVDKVTGINPTDDPKTFEEWEDKYGGAILGDANIDVSSGSGDRDADSVTHGGGSQIIVNQPESGNGSLTVTTGDGEEDTGHFTLTGTADHVDENGNPVTGVDAVRDSVVAKDENGNITDKPVDVVLKDDTQLDLGYSNSQGGIITGDLKTDESDASGKDGNVDVAGGIWVVEGEVNLEDGNLTISDEQNETGRGSADLVVNGSVDAGSLDMIGGDTSLNTGGAINIAGSINASGNAQIGSESPEDKFAISATNPDSSLTAGEINLSGNASIDRGPVTLGKDESSGTTGDLTIVDNSSLTAEGTDTENVLTVGGDTTIGKADHSDNPKLTVNGDASFEGDFTQNSGVSSVTGDSTVAGDYNQTGGNSTVGGNHQVDGTITVSGGSHTVAGDLSGGSLTASNGSSVTAGDISLPSANGGSGDLVVTDSETSVSAVADEETRAQGNIDIAGSASVSNGGSVTADGDFEADGSVTVSNGGSVDVAGDLTANGEDKDGNGLVVGEKGATTETVVDVGGKVTVGAGANTVINGNGSLTVGAADLGGDLIVAPGGEYIVTADKDGTVDTDVDGSLVVGSGGEGSLRADVDLGDAHIGRDATISNSDVDSGDIKVGGSASVTEGSTVNAAGDMTIGNQLEVGGDAGSSGSSVTVDGKLTVGTNGSTADTVIHGNGSVVTGAGDLNGNLTVGDVDSRNQPNGSYVSSGDTSVSGDLTVNKDGSYSSAGNTDVGGKLVVETGGSMSVGSSQADGTLTVTGKATVNGTVSVAGTADFSGGLVVGSVDFVPDDELTAPNGAVIVSGNTDVTGDLVVNDYGTVDVGFADNQEGSLTVTGNTTIGENASVAAEGDITFGSDGSKSFDLGQNSVVIADSVSFGQDTKFGGDDGKLNGFITGSESIDFSGAAESSSVVFDGLGAGLQTGKLIGDVTLENGATAVIASGEDASGGTVDGWLTANAGDGSSTIGSTISTNPNYRGPYEDNAKPSESNKDATLYLDSTLGFAAGSGAIVGSPASTVDKTTSGVYFGDNSSLVINASNMTSGDVLFDNGTASGMPVYVKVSEGQTVDVNMSGWTMGVNGSLVFDVKVEEGQDVNDLFNFTGSSLLQDFELAQNNGITSITMQANAVGDVTGGTINGELEQVINNVVTQGGPSYVNQAFNAVFTDTENSRFGTMQSDGKFALNATGNKVLKEIATFPVTAGAFNATYDYLTEFNRAVESRAQEKRIGDTNNAVWAQVIATYNKSDELFSDASGYKADLYGGVLGTDVRLGNGTLIGGALTVGTGDIESRGAVIGTKNDATFYGLSVYAQHDIGLMSLKGDVTYLRTENDIAGTFEGVNMGGSMDSDAVSLGVRAEFAAYSSDTFEVKPHIGLRYTSYSFDDYNGTEIDDVNALEAPIGVAFSGKVQAKGGWMVVPELDLSVVPQLGDKEASVVNAGAAVDQRVLEGAVFNAKIGLGMQKDNFTFGANFQHGAGGFSRNNNAFQAFARWTF